eukprot:m.350046 g.350046  ORF g.350046 m.350046 type:complete len:62 (-) comp45660_c0_seq1:49-234(-)
MSISTKTCRNYFCVRLFGFFNNIHNGLVVSLTQKGMYIIALIWGLRGTLTEPTTTEKQGQV